MCVCVCVQFQLKSLVVTLKYIAIVKLGGRQIVGVVVVIALDIAFHTNIMYFLLPLKQIW